MHTTRKRQDVNGADQWWVGWCTADDVLDPRQFRTFGYLDTFDDAAQWVSYLNGGSKPTGPGPHSPPIEP